MIRDVNKIVLHKNDTVLKALELLDLYALRIVLVVDDHNQLIGSITDGDIRRGLLKGQDVHAAVETIMHTNPYSIEEGGLNNRQIFEIMREKSYLALPVIKNNQLVNIITLDDLIRKKRKENPVFIMAGGFGTRLRPLTDNCPKPMLPVGRKPLLETIILSLKEQGFYRFYISTHYLPEIIQQYFGDGEKFEVQIQYVHESEPLGTGGALGLLPKDRPDLPIIMMNGDVLTKLNYAELLNHHEKNKFDATLCVREDEHRVPFGVIETENQLITNMVEKPTYHYKINTGIYVLNPEIIDSVQVDQRIDMPTLLEQHRKVNKRIGTYTSYDYWLDIGQMKDYHKAQQDIERLFNEDSNYSC